MPPPMATARGGFGDGARGGYGGRSGGFTGGRGPGEQALLTQHNLQALCCFGTCISVS